MSTKVTILATSVSNFGLFGYIKPNPDPFDANWKDSESADFLLDIFWDKKLKI